MIKGIMNTIKLLRFGHVNGHVLKIMQYQDELIKKCLETNEPIMGKIEIHADVLPNQHHPFLSFWIGIGDCSPLDRIRELRDENDRLKLVLSSHSIFVPEKTNQQP